MTHELVIPNWHVILVHAPLAMLLFGTFIEFFAWFWPNSSFRVAGVWMILIGALASIPAALSGVYALSDVIRMSLPEDDRLGTWNEMIAASPIGVGTDAWQMLVRHALFNMAALLIFGFIAVIGLASVDIRRSALRVPLLLLLLIGVGLIVVGAWYGGETVYRHGAAVIPASERMIETGRDAEPATEPPTAPAPPEAQPAAAQVPVDVEASPVEPLPTVDEVTPPTTAPTETPAAEETMPPAPVEERDEPVEAAPEPTPPADVPEPVVPEADAVAEPADPDAAPLSPAAEEQFDLEEKFNYILPPLQLHILLAGVAIAIALAAIGLSFRASNVAIEARAQRNNGRRDDLGAIAGAFGARPAGPMPYDIEPPIAPDRPNLRQVIPASRFWLLSALLSLFAATAGAAFFLSEWQPAWPWNLREIWNDAFFTEPGEISRRLAHIVGGGVLVVVPVIAAIVARVMPRQRWLLGLLSLLVVLAVAAQVWVGLLLTWDRADGPVTWFQ